MKAVTLEFCQQLPKLEVHAHINGSASSSTIEKLVQLKRQREPGWGHDGQWKVAVEKGSQRTMADVFEMFALLHQLCDSDAAIYQVTKDVIDEFYADNVKYLELRTTPRGNQATGMTKKSYISSVLQAIKEQEQALSDVTVRLLLSIDRRTTLEDARDTLDLCLSLKGECVVGLDLSGDPAKGNIEIFLPVFQQAKEHGLKTAFHVSEIKGQSSSETAALLGLHPDRVGHATFLHEEVGGSQQNEEHILSHAIPIEICLTSNLKTSTVTTAGAHHFGFWYKRGHPCILGTDDKGVFATSLSEDYFLISQTYQLSREDLWVLSLGAIEYCFCDTNVKSKLNLHWQTWRSEHRDLFT